jgi:hypothetical protein
MDIHQRSPDIKLILRDISIDEEEAKREHYIVEYDKNMLMRNVLN